MKIQFKKIHHVSMQILQFLKPIQQQPNASGIWGKCNKGTKTSLLGRHQDPHTMNSQ